MAHYLQPTIGSESVLSWEITCTEPDSADCRRSGKCRLVEWFYGMDEWDRNGVFSGTKVLPRFEVEYAESEYSDDITTISPLTPEIELGIEPCSVCREAASFTDTLSYCQRDVYHLEESE